MNQDQKDAYFLNLAMEIAKASKCFRAKYGTVIVSADSRIVSTGFNGKPRGSSNDHTCYRLNLPPNSGKISCCIHSEANALMFCSPEERKDGAIYVSGMPCTDCMLLIMQSGVYRCVYLDEPTDTGHAGNTTHEFVDQYGWLKDHHFYGISRKELRYLLATLGEDIDPVP